MQGLVVATVALATILTSCLGQLHFASIGSWGSGTRLQKTVATTLKNAARPLQLSFVVSPGSNFVSGGVKDLNDTAWQTQFSGPFESPDMFVPFFTVLGEADWRGNFSALAARSQLEYAAPASHQGAIPRWTLPNWWYYYSQHFKDASQVTSAIGGVESSVGLVFVDTYILSEHFAYSNITEKHWNMLRDTLMTTSKLFDWTIVVGDQAMLSSGSSRGNRYLYRTLGKFLKEHHVDTYISGNDWDMEVVEDGTLVHVNCGSGSHADPVLRIKVKGSVAYVAKPGFCHHIVKKGELTTEFIDGNTGEVLHTYTQKRSERPRPIYNRFSLFRKLPEITFIPIPPFGDKRQPVDGDWFVGLIGTLGLLVLGYVALMGCATVIRRAQK